MSDLKRTKAEYGGFLPLELNPGKELFAKYEPMLMRFNTVKAAINYLIMTIKVKRIYIPYYYCPSTIKAIKQIVSEVCFYHIDKDLLPTDLPDEDDTAILLVDYFGVRSRETVAFAEGFEKAEIILDFSHSFFTEAVIKNNVHSVYSAKKFLGIPDGAYLVSNAIEPDAQNLTVSTKYAEYLIMTYEEGTNAAYEKKKEADHFLNSNYAHMSKLALGLLNNVDYDRVYTRRKENYEFLRQRFQRINELNLPSSKPAYQFPLLLKNKGEVLKRTLIDNKIFVPTLWLGEDLMASGSEFEITMSRDAVFLPIDQRYDLDDMAYIADKVDEFLENLTQS